MKEREVLPSSAIPNLLLEIFIRAILEGKCSVEWVLRQTYRRRESTKDLEDDGTEANVTDPYMIF